MNKSELSETVAKGADVAKAAAGNAIGAITATITAAVAKGDSVMRVGFRACSSSKRAARTGCKQ